MANCPPITWVSSRNYPSSYLCPVPVSCVRGSSGPQGPPGPRGAPGPQGPPGEPAAPIESSFAEFTSTTLQSLRPIEGSTENILSAEVELQDTNSAPQSAQKQAVLPPITRGISLQPNANGALTRITFSRPGVYHITYRLVVQDIGNVFAAYLVPPEAASGALGDIIAASVVETTTALQALDITFLVSVPDENTQLVLRAVHTILGNAVIIEGIAPALEPTAKPVTASATIIQVVGAPPTPPGSGVSQGAKKGGHK